MKKIIVVVLCVFFVGKVAPQAVSLDTAKMIANNFYTQITGMQKNAVMLTLYSDKTISNTHKSITQGIYYYIFNTSDNGFVIVSGDKRAIPILAYSTEGNFDTTSMPDNIKWWFSTYEEQIDIAKNQSAVASIDLQQQWNEYILNQPLKNRKGTAAVSALCVTKWNQRAPYNKLCPYDTAASRRTLTGCVATAMAQVMKYWNFPTTGMGIHTSTNTTYGTLTADFGHTSYPWDKMAATNPATTDTNIALLMYHCGVALNMKYGIDESLAGTLGFINDYYFQQGNTDVPTALNNFFKYDSAQGYYRDSCTEAAWITMLKAELDLSRPIVYAGTSASGSGHAFICDGYDNSNNFHMNWGWGGTADGYFALSALNPGSLGVGGGTGGYNTRQRAIMHIIPGDTSTMLYNLQLNSNLSISDTIIKSKSPFTISVQVANIGEGDFNGSFAIALYDSLYHFACYLGEKNNQYIPSMGQDTLLFSMERNYSKYVHSYIAVLHYKSGSLFWKPIDKGLYTNAVKFTIIPQDSAPDMYLSSKMTITPTTVYKDSAFSITAQYSNRGTLPFIGKYAMAVFDSNNQNMGFVGDTNNAYLTNGYSIIKTFTTKGMNLDYGNYYAVAMCKATTDTAWQKLKTMENSYSNYLPFTVKHDVNIVEHNFDAVSISPNPTQGKIFLKRDFDGEAVVKVIDITGRVLSQQTIFTKNFEIDLHAYANGTYIVSIIDGHHIINKKVVKN